MWGHRCAKVSLVPHGMQPRGLRSGCDYCMCRNSCTVYPLGLGILGKLKSTGALSPKVSPKTKFSLCTHLAGRVPTWPLYNTQGLPPLNFDPFLGYTGVIPLIRHSQNGPYPQTLVPTVSLKTSFPRVPTYPAVSPHGPSTTPTGSHP